MVTTSSDPLNMILDIFLLGKKQSLVPTVICSVDFTTEVFIPLPTLITQNRQPKIKSNFPIQAMSLTQMQRLPVPNYTYPVLPHVQLFNASYWTPGRSAFNPVERCLAFMNPYLGGMHPSSSSLLPTTWHLCMITGVTLSTDTLFFIFIYSFLLDADHCI